MVGVSRSGRHVDDALRRHVHHDAAGSGAAGDGGPGHGLPGTAETEGILSRSRIALLPKETVVVNVGRGTAIDQDALMEALNADGWPVRRWMWCARSLCLRSIPCGTPKTSC